MKNSNDIYVTFTCPVVRNCPWLCRTVVVNPNNDFWLRLMKNSGIKAATMTTHNVWESEMRRVHDDFRSKRLLPNRHAKKHGMTSW